MGEQLTLSCSTHTFAAVLFGVLGLGSWITVNGMFQELPLIAPTAPEKYGLFSWINLAIAASNVFPLAYLALVARLSSGSRRWADAFASALLLGVLGAGACVALAFGWRASRGGVSWALILLAFLSGGVDCTTSVLFFPLAVRFPSSCTSALFVGECVTGLFAATLAIAQAPTGIKPNRDPEDTIDSLHFSIGSYFGILGGVMLCAAAASIAIFVVERRVVSRAKQRGAPVRLVEEREAEAEERISAAAAAGGEGRVRRTFTSCVASVLPPSASRDAAVTLLFSQFALAFVENGIYVTLLPRSLKLYPASTSLISVTMKVGFGGAGLAAIFALFLSTQRRRTRWLRERVSPPALRVGAIVIVAIGALWIVVTAAAPVAPGSLAFGVCTVIVAVLCKWFLSFYKTLLFLNSHPDTAELLEEEAGEREGKGGGNAIMMDAAADAEGGGVVGADAGRNEGAAGASLPEYDIFRWGGAGIQAGSACGALLFFVLAEICHAFH